MISSPHSAANKKSYIENVFICLYRWETKIFSSHQRLVTYLPLIFSEPKLCRIPHIEISVQLMQKDVLHGTAIESPMYRIPCRIVSIWTYDLSHQMNNDGH